MVTQFTKTLPTSVSGQKAQNKTMYDIIVIGGGPAGLTSALYVARAGKSVLIIEQNAFGGQMATAPKIENFPGVDSIDGATLANNMFEQAVAHGVEFDMGSASICVVNEPTRHFVVTTEYAQYQAKSVIIASGVSHKHLGVDGESELVGNGVCYCAVCDGSFYKDKPVVVVGDGNSAVQYALYLATICSQVTLLTWSNKLFCDGELAQRLKTNDKIEWVQNATVKQIVGDSCVTGVAYADEIGAITYHDCDAVFVAIGQLPHNETFADVVALDDRGYIVAGEDCKTTCPGIFVAGDCRTKAIRQCATAVGDGAVAGFSASMYVDKL